MLSAATERMLLRRRKAPEVLLDLTFITPKRRRRVFSEFGRPRRDLERSAARQRRHTATDQWAPSVAVASNGVVGVMFYDRRNDPANLNIDVYLVMSTNVGRSARQFERLSILPVLP